MVAMIVPIRYVSVVIIGRLRTKIGLRLRTTLGNIENKVVAVGSWVAGNAKVEIFDINSDTWTSKTSFPFCSEL